MRYLIRKLADGKHPLVVAARQESCQGWPHIPPPAGPLNAVRAAACADDCLEKLGAARKLFLCRLPDLRRVPQSVVVSTAPRHGLAWLARSPSSLK
jgi:hypothetical protein